MPLIREIYNHCKSNNKPMLMTNTVASLYPVLNPSISKSFVQYYLENYQYFDRLFSLKYGEKVAMLTNPALTTHPHIYDDWILNVNSVVIYNLNNWARLWLAMMLDYNPLWNVDGITITTTDGIVEGLSGSDIDTHLKGAQHDTNTYGNTHSTHNDWVAPYDALSNIEADPSYSGSDPNLTVVRKVGQTDDGMDSHTDQHNSDTYTDTDTMAYGKKNEVDYTVTEERSGNIGVTSTQSLLEQSFELAKKSFFDLIFNTLSRELTLWEV